MQGHVQVFIDGQQVEIVSTIPKWAKISWSQVAQRVGGRIGKQCRERWYNHLHPGIRKGEWTPEEEEIIIEKHKIFGNRWVEIARFLPGRTENATKNHWNACLARRIQSANVSASTTPPLSESKGSAPTVTTDAETDNSPSRSTTVTTSSAEVTSNAESSTGTPSGVNQPPSQAASSTSTSSNDDQDASNAASSTRQAATDASGSVASSQAVPTASGVPTSSATGSSDIHATSTANSDAESEKNMVTNTTEDTRTDSSSTSNE